MKTTGVSCETKFRLLFFFGTPYCTTYFQNHHHNAGIILVIPIFTMPTRVGAVVRFWTLCKCDPIDCIFFSQNKSTDFTTFLNTPGCALGKHSNVKPINPEKITGNLNKEPEPVVVETRPPIQPEGKIRKCNPDLRWQSQKTEIHWTMHEEW